jgi:hypothetical protein
MEIQTEQENLLPKRKPFQKYKGVVYTEENVFFGSGFNPFHYTNDGLKTLCGCKITFLWRKDKKNKLGVSCKRCLKKLKEKSE